MLKYFKSLIIPENAYIKILSRFRVVTDLILILITIFIFFQLRMFYYATTTFPELHADSFDDFSMIVYTMPGLQNPSHYVTNNAYAFLYDTKIMDLSVSSSLDYILLNSKYPVCLILLLIVFYKIRRLIFSLDKKKSFSKQLMEGLKKISRLIIYFSIIYILVSIFNRTYSHWYFSEFLIKAKIDGWVLAPYKLLAIDIIIAVFIFLLGILLNVLSKFFILGVELQQENDLTV